MTNLLKIVDYFQYRSACGIKHYVVTTRAYIGFEEMYVTQTRAKELNQD